MNFLETERWEMLNPMGFGVCSGSQVSLDLHFQAEFESSVLEMTNKLCNFKGRRFCLLMLQVDSFFDK